MHRAKTQRRGEKQNRDFVALSYEKPIQVYCNWPLWVLSCKARKPRGSLCAFASWRDHYPFKVFQITSVLLFIVLAFGIARAAEPFDEAAWRRTVESQPVEKLYAPHFKDGKYFNPWLPMEGKNFWRFLKWRFSKKALYTEEEKNFRATVIPNLKDRIATLPMDDFIAWIGHATFLIRLQGEYWLTDPMFSERALLPKRVSPPAMPVEDLQIPRRETSFRDCMHEIHQHLSSDRSHE